ALVLIGEDVWQGFLDSGRDFGFIPRAADVLAFAGESHVLLLNHQPSRIDVDISLGGLPFEKETIARAIPKDLEKFSVDLPTPEDLIILKAIANRPRDLVDIEAVLDKH